MCWSIGEIVNERIKTMKIVILAGGGGTRLFPLSRSCYPKQFLSIAGKKSLLAQSVERFLSIVSPKDIVIVTNARYIFHVKEEMEKIGTTGVYIITEPVGRNTAPAIALGIQFCIEKLHCKDDEVLFVSPSDHMINPVEPFVSLVVSSEQVARDGFIVTMGVKPDYPETGYGYIEAASERIHNAFRVISFREKPDEATARKYIAAGKYFWNSGMFMFNIRTMRGEMAKFTPEILTLLSSGYENTLAAFEKMPNISIDYAIAEKSRHIAVVPMEQIYWNDIGSFDAIADVLGDANGNSAEGDVLVNDCENTMILGDKRLIVGIELQDLMVVDTPDVLLLAKRGESQKVKEVVDKLKTARRHEVEDNVTMYRPWGSYTILAEGPGYKVKRLTVKPLNRMSLQIHFHRSEHWTVISGTGKITLDDKEIILRENESTFIPIGSKHRLENPGKIPLLVIEVQNGKYLNEDDIVRFDDDYERKLKG